MEAIEIIETISASGGQLWLEGDKVRARLPERLRALVDAIRERKPEIIELLMQRPIMPADVRLIRWEPKPAPVQVSRCERVTEVRRFIEGTLAQIDARLHGKTWLAGNWPLSGLIDRLAAVGYVVTLEDRKAMLQ